VHLVLALFLAACGGDERNLKRPNAVALAGDGRVFVSDLHHKRIVVFDGEGRQVGTIARPGLGDNQLWDAWELEFLPPDRLVVVQMRPEEIGRGESFAEVREFEAGRQVLARRILQQDGQAVDWVEGLSAGPERTWLVPAFDGDGLLRFGSDWTCLGRWHPLEEGGRALAPTDVHWDGEWLWVVEQRHHRVHRFGPDGQRQVSFGELGTGAGQLSFPISLGVCPGQWVAVADHGNHRLQRFDLDGKLLDAFAPIPSGPDSPVQLMSLAVPADCERLYLVDSKGSRVLVTKPSGELLQELSTW